jgi:N-acetylmuramoyl-L-alanine amidase
MIHGGKVGRKQLSKRPPGKSSLIIGLFGAAVLLGVVLVVLMTPGTAGDAPTLLPPTSNSPSAVKPTRTPRPSRTPFPTPVPTPTATPTALPPKVGIVAGHWQSDSGAICDDGLQEVTINLDVAAGVVAILQSEGYNVDLLAEYSDRLPGYEADALVSIHTDACNVPEATGFKVARVAASAIPEEEDRLVACLIQEYAEATGLSYHPQSITYDMTVYHAFNEIDPQTPGAIIELGFMAADRDLLTGDSYKVAQGVAKGIICFLEGE